MSTKTTTTTTTVSGRGSSSSGEFDVTSFEKRLRDLKDTQDSIQHLSSWCLSRRAHHKKIVSSWLNVLKQVKIESRLTLFHLANDVIQNSKRKNYEYVDSWGTYLQKATTLVRDEKATNLVMAVRECVKHQSETDHTFKGLNKKPHVDVEAVMNSIKGKDRSKVEEMEQEIEEHLAQYENVVGVLKKEQKTRQELLTLLEQAGLFYENQRTEVKVVVNAYRNFGNRLKSMKKKLDELTVSLPSPIPSPDINAPSPVPSDGDNILPNDDNYFQMLQHHGSYMGGNIAFDMNDFTRSDSPMVMNRGRCQSSGVWLCGIIRS
uniref:CID domain-containing protein n=1 Tax=Anopheles culicifacies TaxID=139723 RepID=A0A182M0Q6_9DIPT